MRLLNGLTTNNETLIIQGILHEFHIKKAVKNLNGIYDFTFFLMKSILHGSVFNQNV